MQHTWGEREFIQEFVGNASRKGTNVRPRRGLEDNIKIYFREIE
jgi:hypothetical protein